jgi:hypothetical protein
MRHQCSRMPTALLVAISIAAFASASCGGQDRRVAAAERDTPPLELKLPADAGIGDLARAVRDNGLRSGACFLVQGDGEQRLRRRARVTSGGKSFEVGWTCDPRELIPIVLGRAAYSVLDDYEKRSGMLDVATVFLAPRRAMVVGALFLVGGSGRRTVGRIDLTEPAALAVIGVPARPGDDPFEQSGAPLSPQRHTWSCPDAKRDELVQLVGKATEARMDALHACVNPGAAGALFLTWLLRADGGADTVDVHLGQLTGEADVACLKRVVSEVRVPAEHACAGADVTVPLIFDEQEGKGP